MHLKETADIHCQHKPSVSSKTEAAGITLVALVVTVVILLILAGITLVYMLGENSVFYRASDAKLKTDIAKYKEMLETAKTPIIIEGRGITFNKEKYFEEIEKKKIINDKTKDVIDNEDGTYEVTTTPGYVYEIKLMPNKEDSNDVKITYIGQSGKLPPKITNINVTGKTGTSIDIEVEVTRLENGKLSYYYRESTEDNSKDYIKVKEDVADLTATIENLEDGKIYDIKVVVKNKYGLDDNEISATCNVKVEAYVKDGLIVWYDGINNTGTGTHSNTATTWKNLAGDDYNGTIGGATWNSDHLSFDGINDYLRIAVIEPENITLEVVASIEEDSGEIDLIDNLNGAGVALASEPPRRNIQFIIHSGGYKRVYSTEEYVLNRKYSISGGYNGTYMYVSQNNKRTTQSQTGNIKYSSSAPMEIGRNSRNSGNNYCAGIKVYSARIYNRMLTESEVTQNYNVDKARFNIQE